MGCYELENSLASGILEPCQSSVASRWPCWLSHEQLLLFTSRHERKPRVESTPQTAATTEQELMSVLFVAMNQVSHNLDGPQLVWLRHLAVRSLFPALSYTSWDFSLDLKDSGKGSEAEWRSKETARRMTLTSCFSTEASVLTDLQVT